MGARTLDVEGERMLQVALRHPRGRYTAERASQLSGVPKSTLYDWRRNAIYVPDFSRMSPTAWSYRDLIFLRLLAWLRQTGMPRPGAAKAVTKARQVAAKGSGLRHIHATREAVYFDDQREASDGRNMLPFDDFLALVSTFDLLAPIEELKSERGRLWAPDLVAPTARTYISPWVLAGDPCVSGTRVPTASMYALASERQLSATAIAALYPALKVRDVEDAWLLERRLRGVDLPEPAAA
jgi:uncharacterized protein (DUF433 family)